METKSSQTFFDYSVCWNFGWSLGASGASFYRISIVVWFFRWNLWDVPTESARRIRWETCSSSCLSPTFSKTRIPCHLVELPSTCNWQVESWNCRTKMELLKNYRRCWFVNTSFLFFNLLWSRVKSWASSCDMVMDILGYELGLQYTWFHHPFLNSKFIV